MTLEWSTISKDYSQATQDMGQITQYGKALITDTTVSQEVSDLESLLQIQQKEESNPTLKTVVTNVIAKDQAVLSNEHLTLHSFLNDGDFSLNTGSSANGANALTGLLGGTNANLWTFINDAATNNKTDEYGCVDGDYKAYYSWQSGTDPHNDDDGLGLTYDSSSTYNSSRAKEQETAWGYGTASQLVTGTGQNNASSGGNKPYITFDTDANATADEQIISGYLSALIS